MATNTVSAATAESTKLNHQAFMLLRTIFTVAPIVFGLDKFTNLLTDWTHYLAPIATDIIPVSPQVFMYCGGRRGNRRGHPRGASPEDRIAGRRALAARHHRQPADDPQLLRRCTARLRAAGRGPGPEPSGNGARALSPVGERADCGAQASAKHQGPGPSLLKVRTLACVTSVYLESRVGQASRACAWAGGVIFFALERSAATMNLWHLPWCPPLQNHARWMHGWRTQRHQETRGNP